MYPGKRTVGLINLIAIGIALWVAIGFAKENIAIGMEVGLALALVFCWSGTIKEQRILRVKNEKQ